jgi:predicted RNase H-like HicB family nuclease
VNTLRVGVTIHREGGLYIAVDPVTSVASQGKTFDEEHRNFQEAFEAGLSVQRNGKRSER